MTFGRPSPIEHRQCRLNWYFVTAIIVWAGCAALLVASGSKAKNRHDKERTELQRGIASCRSKGGEPVHVYDNRLVCARLERITP